MKQNGFTLIELMITIVIIAILAGIAVPQYLAYTKRAEVAELVALADIVKKKVGIFYSTKGRWPDPAMDKPEDVGLDAIMHLVVNGIGVSSNNDPSCSEFCAALVCFEDCGVIAGGDAAGGGAMGPILAYAPETGQAALTWRCVWYGEEKYPGAKPDGCEDA